MDSKFFKYYVGIPCLIVMTICVIVAVLQLTQKVNRLEHKVLALESANLAQPASPLVKYAPWDDVRALNSGAHHKIDRVQLAVARLNRKLETNESANQDKMRVRLEIKNIPNRYEKEEDLRRKIEMYVHRAGFTLTNESVNTLYVYLPTDMENNKDHFDQVCMFDCDLLGVWRFTVENAEGFTLSSLKTEWGSAEMQVESNCNVDDDGKYDLDDCEFEDLQDFLGSALNIVAGYLKRI